MKELFIIWITFQLIVIGAVCVQIDNDIKNKTLDCSKLEDDTPEWKGALYPLVVFIPNGIDNKIKEYCLDKK